MADREKVISKLQILRTWCAVNPNYGKGLEPEDCTGMVSVLDDALALLKEPEARVMTREELIHSKDWVWYQWKNTHCGWTVAVNCDGKWIEWEDSTTDQLCKYGKKWRCWTSRPTPEQMRETPWEGEYDG